MRNHAGDIKIESQAQQQQAKRPWLLAGCEQWQPEELSTSSDNSSSLFLPMQDAWGDAFAQPLAADATPMLWQPQADSQAEHSMSTVWLPSSAASSMESLITVSNGSIGAIELHSLPLQGASQHLVDSPYLQYHLRAAC